jgi:6-phosphogluconolactonase
MAAMTSDRITIVQRGTCAAQEIAARFAAAGRRAWEKRGRFVVALSPAVIDAPLVAALATAPIGCERFWRGTHLFLTDTWHTDAGASWARLRASATRLPLARGAVHFDCADQSSAVTGAKAYEQEIRAFFGLATGELPEFDLCLLALGEDGRVGGLVPGSPALDEVGRLVVADFAPGAGRCVLTLTPPVIQHAASLVLVAAPASHDTVARRVFTDTPPARFNPLRLLRAAAGEVAVVIGSLPAALPASLPLRVESPSGDGAGVSPQP